MYAWIRDFHPLSDQFSLTGTKVEGYIQASVSCIYASPCVAFIPTVIILGLSIVVDKEFRILKSQISEDIRSKQNINETTFYSYKQKFEEICDIV